MRTQVISATPVDISFIVEMMAVRIADRATLDDCIVNFDDCMLELSECTYSVDCSVVVSFANIDHRGDGITHEPQPDIIDNYGIFGLTVLKCLPDEQFELDINPDSIESGLRGSRPWHFAKG